MQLRNEVDDHCQPCESAEAMTRTSDLSIVGALRNDTRTKQSRYHRDVNYDGPSYDQPLALGLREMTWLKLLHERPNLNDSTRMATWLDKVLAFSNQEKDTSREGGIHRSSSTTSFTETHLHPVSPCVELLSDTDLSAVAVDRQNFGRFAQSSTSIGDSFGLTSQESAKVASEIAEFEDFIDGLDLSLVFA